MEIKEAVDIILLASDSRMRKVFFPWKAWYSNYLRPFFPDYVDK